MPQMPGKSRKHVKLHQPRYESHEGTETGGSASLPGTSGSGPMTIEQDGALPSTSMGSRITRPVEPLETLSINHAVAGTQETIVKMHRNGDLDEIKAFGAV